MNVENEFSYNYFQYSIVDHVFTFGYAAMAAGLVYFLVTSSSSLPRYRLSSALSAVVMVSAFLELLVISLQWQRSFVWDGTAFVVGDELFGNGYRYMNWSIDVPVLLVQMLIVLGVTGVAFRRGVVLFVAAGLAMVYTGYVGQYYEVDRSAPFWVWGAVSTVFFAVILVLVWRTVYGNVERMPAEVRPMVKAVFWLLAISWMLYPGAYLMPAIWDSADGVVARQITYTVADVTSKVVYGVLLSAIAVRVSKLEGFGAARDSISTIPRGGVTDVDAPGRV
ncbi:bacteriorhodopsin [uncultured Pseudokineococcus sp.]|uniref:bacteriorhodopsin n=1 Tax=uncultured Pseudokineococcus sp. TaxID=1642928 RepID=UPI0026087B57|nr:bacteriorhodopsin [uncultured Pseudokineococcus sp.]